MMDHLPTNKRYCINSVSLKFKRKMNNYKKIFRESLDNLKKDGNYRIFADLEKIAGNFPQALNYKDNSVSEVTVWCSNDYLGMSQNDIVIKSMIEAIKKWEQALVEQEIYLELIITTSCSKENYVTYIRKNRHFYSILDILPIKQHFLHLEKKLPDCVFFPTKKSCIHDSRNEKLWRKKSNI